MKKLIIVLMALLLIFACASNPGIVEVSKDTYIISRIDKAGIFGNAAKMKADVIQEATAFAKNRGKVAVPISIDETPMAPGRFASIEYQFRLVEENDPSTRDAKLANKADFILEAKSQVSVKDESKDIYEELIKLDDLRKKGIITDEEFEAEKRKLLSR
ncbi:SHOCT domain-containing protein [Alteromonas flava]|uniref:SHOCT domain-containing protein n=1 Tax=Alteromonas flava TaxID=2048003 RepID=UPI000C290277|nr:SHOCT domain-containing protein [Alteromonas flava]